jgi:hypothetical protein
MNKKEKEGVVQLLLVKDFGSVLVRAEDSQYNKDNYIMQDT